MKIKKLISSIDKLSFSYKTSFLIFIITSGMISVIVLSQISIYTLKNDFDVLFEKRTKPITKLEIIKDTYKINIYDTFYDIQSKHLTITQAKDVISLGQQLISKNWLKYKISTQGDQYKQSRLTSYIKDLFSINKSDKNIHILRDNAIKNIDKRITRINKKIIDINSLLWKKQNASELIEKMYFEINSINIYITNLTNHDLKLAIHEKNNTEKVFEILTMILNIAIIFVFLFSVILSVLLVNNFRKLHFGLEEIVNEKTRELQKLNESLENRIKKEVANSRKKDLIMIQQSKLASMGEMLQNIAHQWRQPLGSLLMIIQSFQTKMEFGKLTNKFVEQKVEDALLLADNMSNTLDDFQNFFKPNKVRTLFKLEDCLEHSLELSKYLLEKEQINIIMQIEKDIEIFTFYNELSHVFLNIVNNSKDALATNLDNDRHIKIIVKKVENNVLIKFIDNGGGIPNDILPKIFEPYYTTKYKSAGTGIGLYMSKQIIEKHMHGFIKCKNIYYKIIDDKQYNCTIFTITIPMEGNALKNANK